MATPGSCVYRGYPIEDLAEKKATYLETAYLLLHGETTHNRRS